MNMNMNTQTSTSDIPRMFQGARTASDLRGPYSLSRLTREPEYMTSSELGLSEVSNVYESKCGLRALEPRDDAGFTGWHEVLRIDENIGLMFWDQVCNSECEDLLIGDDWISVQIRLHGRSVETFGGKRQNLLPNVHCSVNHFPVGSERLRRIGRGERYSGVSIAFPRGALEEVFDLDENVLERLMRFDQEEPRQTSILPIKREIYDSAMQIMNCSFQGRMRKVFLCAKTIELLCETISVADRELNLGGNKSRKLQRDIDRLRLARQIIEEDATKPESLQSLARRVGICRTKLASGFKELFGETVGEFRMQRRLAIAWQLLESEKLSVSEVAVRVGYSDANSLRRAFTSHYGFSPSQILKV